MLNSELARPGRLEALQSGVPRSPWNTVKYPEQERKKRVPEEARQLAGGALRRRPRLATHSRDTRVGGRARGAALQSFRVSSAGLQPRPARSSRRETRPDRRPRVRGSAPAQSLLASETSQPGVSAPIQTSAHGGARWSGRDRMLRNSYFRAGLVFPLSLKGKSFLNVLEM